MNKVILMSIRPEWLVKILNGEKTVELRKRFPKNYRGWVYLYCTKGKSYLVYDSLRKLYFTNKRANFKNLKEENCFMTTLNGKVVGRVWVDNVETISLFPEGLFATKSLGSYDLLLKSRLLLGDFISYFNINERIFKHNIVCYHLGFAIHFSKLEIFDKPKELREFYEKGYLDYIKPCEHPRYPETYKDFYKSVLKVAKHKFKLIKAPQSWQYVWWEKNEK